MQLPRFFRLASAAGKVAWAMEECQSLDRLRRDRLFFAVSVRASPVAMKTCGHSGVHARFLAEVAWIFTSPHVAIPDPFGFTPSLRRATSQSWPKGDARCLMIF